MGDNQNIELQIPLTAATEATSKTQNQSCTFRWKCAAVDSGGIVSAIIIAVMLLIPQDTTPPTPNDPPMTPPDDPAHDDVDGRMKKLLEQYNESEAENDELEAKIAELEKLELCANCAFVGKLRESH